jgi:tetratricopeptide (TPR) repeat protein
MKIRQIVSIMAILVMIASCVLPVAAEAMAEPTPTPTPDLALQNFNSGQKSLANSDFQTALEYFNQALLENTSNMAHGDSLMFLYKDKTGVLTELGRYDEALATADKGLALYPKSAGLWNNKGWVYYKMGKYSQAADAYGNAVRIDPSYLKGWINQGDALVKAGRGMDAVNAYTKALELDPGNNLATSGLAEAKKQADQATLTIGAMILMVVIVAGLILYVKFRKTDDGKESGKSKK